MRRKITKLMTAFALLVFMAPSMVGWGQSYSLYSGSLVEGDYLIVYQGKAMKNTISSNRLQYQEVTVSNDVITTTSDAIVWHIAPSGNYWTIYNADVAKYAAGNGTKNQATLLTSGTDDGSLWTASGSSTYEFVNKKNADANVNKNLRNNGTYGFACYGTGTGGALSLYKLVETNDPSITASNVSIAYNATEGFISYEINNPTNDGQLSAATDADWITYVSVGTQVHFNCYSNDGLERTATITLTYTYNTNQTVTKDVTVTQAADPDALGAINNPYTVAEARAAIDAGTGVNGVYATGIVSQVTSYNSTYHSITYWISDDGTQTNELEAYGGISGIDGWTFSSTNDIQVGATVVICGNLKKYGDTYEFDLNNQLVSYTAPAVTVATPTFNPNGGTFTEVQSVTISCETPNVTIYYTTDGTDPSNESTLYEGPITVGETMTLKARAYDSANNASTIASATFTINLPYTGDPYARVNNVSYLTDGAKVIFAARFDGNANQYYAMTAAATGKPTGVLFTSTTSNDLEVLPAAIVNSESTYCWTVGVTNNGFTFTNANGQVIGYTSSTNFATGGDNIEWTVALGTSGESAMVPSYEAFNIVNYSTINASTVRAFALNNLHNFGPYAISNNNSADYNFSIDIFVQGAEPVAIPSITANNVAIEYNVTSGSIAYSITNEPSSAGTMTAAIAEGGTIANLSLGTIANGIVPFTCDANMSGASRTATITLTYTYNRATVTKNVTITQAANPNYVMTIAEVRALSTGTTVTTKGIVTSCVGTTGYIQDATAAICVFGANLTVGDEIKVTGPLTNYFGLLEIGSNSTAATVDEVISQNNTILPELMTIAEINASTNQGWYVRIEDATVSVIDGKNVTIAQGEDNVLVRFANTEDITFAVSDVVSLDGNIGAYNGVQIANPQNITVQANTEPTITVTPATINAPAEGENGTLTVTYENFTPSVINVYFCNAEGVAATYDWIEAEINDDDNVDYTIYPNEGAARTAYLKVVNVGDAETYSNFVTINQEAAPTVATLPFVYDGNGLGVLPDGLTQHGLTDKYNSSPKMKFDETGDWLLLHFDGTPGILTFDIKGNPGSGDWSGTFTVQTSEDGVTYSELATYTELTNTVQHESFSSLGENVRYIKWIYTEKVSGNVALGNIVLQPYVAPQEYTLTVSGLSNVELYVFDASNENQAIIEGEGSAQVLSGTVLEISVSAMDGYVLESLVVNGENVISQIDETGVYTFTMPTHNVTVTATAIEYVAGNYVRISDLSQLTDGCKVIIAARYDEDHTNGYYAMPGVTSGKPTGVAFTSETSGTDEILPATITNSEDTYYWTVNVTEDGYTFTNANNQMIGYTSGTDFSNGNSAHKEWTIARETAAETAMVAEYTGFVIRNGNTNTRAFAFNGEKFGAYSTTANIAGSSYNFYLDFFVQTAASEIVTQTIELTEGWNWISTYIDLNVVNGIALLEEALGDYATEIQSFGDGAEYFGNGEWVGLDDYEWTNAEMVMVNVTEDCTITLAGPTVDPSTVEIEIYPEWNWIGFPVDVETNIEVAMGDFEPIDEDIIASSTEGYDYLGEWIDIETLVPGQGYMYYSNSTEPKTLYFQAGNAKAKKVVR